MTELALTPLQLREARELLHWSHERLAARMDASHHATARFELGLSTKGFDAANAREIPEAAGIEFDTAGVRLKKMVSRENTRVRGIPLLR